MTALDGFLGRPGDPVVCRTAGELSIHWFAPDAKPGDSCLCGERTKRPDEDDR